MIRRVAILAAAALVASLIGPSGAFSRPLEVAVPSLSELAERYVQLSLKIGEREDGYIDAYYGPPEWAVAAKAECAGDAARSDGGECSYASLFSDVQALWLMVVNAKVDTDDDVRRRIFLGAQLRAASTRLHMMSGEKLSFEDEAEGLFGVRPQLKPLTAYDPVLKEIEALVPGEGPLWQRVDAFNDRFIIPADRLKPVMDAAIAECRKRTMAHIALPANEQFTLEFVTGKSWSGYNWYKGDATSLIQINTDLPVRLSRAVDLGCHEGYPGHHVLNLLLEERLSKGKGWVEFTVYPLYSPQSLIAEGSANYGIDLAFPGDEGLRFEREVLFPLAGLDPSTADKKAQLGALTRRLARAEYTIADDYLSGRVGREESIERLMKYTLASRERATQRLRFIDTYRSYIINYGLGRDVVQAWVERQGPDRWRGIETLLASQILPVDLVD